jgi:DNA-binding XRE family transcriptional regulator
MTGGGDLVCCRQLKAARALAGLTQRGLGQLIGVDERQIRFWERRIPVSDKKRAAIIAAFEAKGVMLLAEPSIGAFLIK